MKKGQNLKFIPAKELIFGNTDCLQSAASLKIEEEEEEDTEAATQAVLNSTSSEDIHKIPKEAPVSFQELPDLIHFKN